MTTLTNSFEGITPSGTTITTGNSGGASGNAFDSITIGSGATLTSSGTVAAHGALSATFATGGSSVTSIVSWTTSMGTQAQVWFRLYLFFTANPAANIQVWRGLQSATQCAVLRVNSTGKLSMLDASSSVISTTATSFPLNTWFRVEGFVTGSATVGQTELKLFTAADSPAPAEVNTSAATQNTLGNMDTYRYGIGSTVANVVAFFADDIGLSNTGYLGPSVVQLPAAQALPGQTWLRRFHHRQNLGPPNQYLVNILPATVSTTGAVTDQAEPVYTATATTTGTLSDQVSKTLPVAASTSGALSRALARVLAAATSTTGSASRQAGKTLPAGVTTGGTLSRAATRALTVTVTTAGALARALTRTYTATATTTGSLARSLGRVFRQAVTTAGSAVLRTAGRPFTITGPVSVTITPGGQSAATVTVTGAGPPAQSPFPPLDAVPGIAVPGHAVPGRPFTTVAPPAGQVPLPTITITGA